MLTRTNTSHDSELWDQFLQGNETAYTYIYKQNVQQLFRYGLVFTPDEELIKDCIHDLFVKIHNNRRTLGKTDNINRYLASALKNLLLNAMAKNSRNTLYAEIEEEKTEEDSPETIYIENETQAETEITIRTILSGLTSRQREIIYYRFIEDRSIDEISELTQMNYQSVANTIQRSLKRIRTFFKKNPE
ncbi:MAG: sigma-70 family RNA polymerase sigma factor [Tannerellaceae bacterium]|nr:sigma-70 family RNA polymerase sigma factor [Tannerellaceae bacterium]